MWNNSEVWMVWKYTNPGRTNKTDEVLNRPELTRVNQIFIIFHCHVYFDIKKIDPLVDYNLGIETRKYKQITILISHVREYEIIS